MADYAKKKNDDLIALCKERGLAHSGKKADLCKRLEDYDTAQTSASATTTAKPAIEDEIDWDDEPATEIAKTATTTQAADAIAAGGIGEVNNPAEVPNQTVVEDPATTDDLTVAAAPETVAPTTESAPPTKEASPEKDFSTGLAERTIDEEIAKRKARARKFGLPEDSDEIKMLERARRFGVQEASKALSEGRKREGRGEKRALDGALSSEAGVRKRSRGDSRRERRSRSRGASRGSGPAQNGQKKAGGEGRAWMSDADKAKADARAKRFAAPA
ncbi:hypothetical protein LTR10_010283 [Elasticomyces elasticus]|nr:hypothetical protein LTR10_010283 [Elasticomyces elasticus]KAK4972188.1 hypothetical protein LTR42_006694 [Elasticomyces elasticus]